MSGASLSKKVGAVIRVSRPRYLSLTLPPFVVGVLASPRHDLAYLGLGAFAIVLLRAICSIGNCVSDRVEDAVDHPERTALCELVGYDRLERIVRVAVATYLVAVLVMATVLGIHWIAIVLWLLYLALKLSYSFGPRLKPRRFGATVLLGSLSGGMLVLGWLGAGVHHAATCALAALLLWLIGATLSGSKDVPNLDGDRAAGYRSVYVRLMETEHPLRHAVAKVSLPYVAVVAMAVAMPLLRTIADWVGGIFSDVLGAGAAGDAGLFVSSTRWQLLWCLAAYPFALAFARILVAARTPLERSLVRECGYLYWITAMGLVCFTLIPTTATAVTMIAAQLWYVLASHIAHPDPAPVGVDDLRRAFAVLRVGPEPRTA